MNTKTAKALRRQFNYHPKQEAKYVALQGYPRHSPNKAVPVAAMVDPTSHKGQYIAAKIAERNSRGAGSAE